MDKDKNIVIPDITGLSKVILETLGEIRKSGNVLNSATFSQFLARKQMVKDLIKLAKKGQDKSIKSRKKAELKKTLQSLDSTGEKKEKNILTQMVEMQLQLDDEKDFSKRVSLILLNLCRIHGNELLYELLDEYKKLIIDDADIEKREKIITEIKNRMLKIDLATKTESDKEEEKDDNPIGAKPFILRKFFGDSHKIKLKPLKKTCIKALEELQSLLDDKCKDSISSAVDHVRDCEDIDYFLSLRKQIVNIIEEYVKLIQRERGQITGFIKEIGKRLIELEGELLMAFTNTSELLHDDYEFSEKLEDQIKGIRKSIESGKDFENLKNIITTELGTLMSTLDEKRKEYTARIEASHQEKEKLRQHFEKMINNVIDKNKVLLEQSQKDPLTGLLNRATFDESINVELVRYRRYMEPFSVIMFDIDHFKQVNDEFGHEAGDRVLKGVAQCTSEILRKTDVFARYGGEEFIILLPRTNLQQSLIAARKLREIVEDTEFAYEGVNVPITVSVGITEVNAEDTEFKSIYNRVDSYMYEAKRGGRNTVVSDLDMNASVKDKTNV